jgi:hypothetical protein
MGLIDVYRINPADQFSVFSPSLKKTQEITYYTLLAKIRGDLNITSTSGNAAQWDEAYRETIVSGAVTGYQTKTITLTRRDGSEISFSFQDLNPIPEDTLDMVTTRGNTTVNTISVGGVLTPWVDLDTSYSNGNIIGRISWDQDNATMDVGLNENTVLKVGQDDLWYVKNQTGSTIPKGTVVMAVGTLGASGRILVAPMVADGSVSPKYILGIASEAIEDGSDGYVLAKGKLRQINTAAYINGQVLWCNPASPGGLTATEPQAPNLKLPIAFVVNAASNGTLAVRINTGSTLSENNQVQFGTLLNNDVLTYVSANSRWQNVPISTLAATAAFSTIAVTGQSSIVADSVSDTLTVASGTAISITTNASTDTLTITNTAPDQIVSLTGAGTTLITGTYPNFTITSNDQYVGTVTSVGLTMPSAFTVTNSPITSSGTIAVTGAGTADQYVRGDGQLANFPTSGGGGSTVSYYLNGSINQGTFGGTTYYEMSKTPIAGAGTNFTRTSAQGAGYIASFITDPGDPALLNIPGGNFNLEIYFSASSSGGGPSFYGELYKVSASNVFTLIGSGSVSPEGITNGTTLDQYFTSISLSQTAILTTDRLAVRIYVDPDGRNITMHTENGNFCEVITTLSTGLNALNGLTAQVQYFATGTAGTDFSINSVTDTHTFNLPTASSVNRGALSSADWITFNGKADFSFKTIAVAGQSGIVADAADDTLTVASGTGITLTTNASTDTLTITNNAPDQTVILTAGTGISTSGTYPSFTITNTAPDQTVVLTAGTGITTSGTYPNFTITNNDRGSSQNIFKNFAVSGQSTIVADSNDDTLTVASGTGISLATNAVSDTLTITNTAPDQTVVLTAGTGISTSGTYPSFTITNTAPDQTVVLTAGTGITTSGTYPSFTITNNDRGSSQNIFKNVAVPTQSTITAANNNDTFTLKPGPGVSITTLTTNNNITINNTDPGSSQYIFKNIAVSGQSTIVADINDDTLTVASGTGISVTTDAVTDTLTFTNTAPDQTVALTAGTGISVTGTYPNFTITNSSPSSGGTVTSIATTAPITGGTITSTGTIGITQSGASTSGFLSSTDWNTFNNKQNALTNPITGTGTTNYLPKFTGTTTLGNSQIFDNGTNVGIGTASPTDKLAVVGNISIFSNNKLYNGSASDSAGISFPSNTTRIDGYSGITFHSSTNNVGSQSERMRITNTGNVGIGTTSPVERLSLSGGTGTTLGLSIEPAGWNGAKHRFSVPTSGDASVWSFNYNGSVVDSALYGTSSIQINQGIVRFSTGATNTAPSEKMRIDSSGNVGIGTTSPFSRFTVSGALSSTTSQISIVNTEGGHSIIRAGISGVSNNGISFVTANVDGSSQNVRMVVGATGNVGIGTTNPSGNLDVTTSTYGLTTNSIRLGNATGDTRSVGQFLGDPAVFNPAVATNTTNGSVAGIKFNWYSDNWMLSATRSAGTAIHGFVISQNSTERLVIGNTGNVGIGTTSPGASIHVAGAINSVPTGDGFLAGIQSGYAVIHLNGTAATGSYIDFSVSGTDTKGRILYDNTNNYFGFNTNGSERLRITSTGDVGIGTTSPSAKLHVIGNVTVSATLSTANAKISGTLADSFNQVGTAGQVLSSTGTGTQWVTGGGGGGSTIIVKDEGTTVGSSFTTLDFYGSNIQAGASGSTAVITALNNAGTGSIYVNNQTSQYAPTASFANVVIDSTTIQVNAPDSAETLAKLIAVVTFGVDNVSDFDGFNNFYFRLYNSSQTIAIGDTEHSWCSYMSKGEFEKRTVFTFHIPLLADVGIGDTIIVQAKQSTAYTPEIYYCALTLIEGTN